jgi:tetratricopeptide (TPR) repeat protein
MRTRGGRALGILRRGLRRLVLAGALLSAAARLRAEQGWLVLYVTDTEGKPLTGVELTVKGDGGTGKVDHKGKARVKLAPETKEASWVTVAIASPANLVFISPWDERAQVPPFVNESQNYVTVVLGERSDKRLLSDPAALRAMVQRANQAGAPTSVAKTETPEEQHKRVLEEVANSFGLEPSALDQAIREWGLKATDPFDRGLAELYARNYAKATPDLETSVALRREQAKKADAALANAEMALGQSLYGQGRYREAIGPFREADRLRPDDPAALGWLGKSLFGAADYGGVEPLFRRALAIDEKALGPDHPDVATDLNNLAALLYAKGDYAGDEQLNRRALAIDEKALGPDHPDVARDLNDLALLLWTTGDYAGAEPLYRHALAIDEKALGPDHPDVARDLNDLALLLFTAGDYAGAEPLYRRALAIHEKALGPDHPHVATCLDNLAALLYARGDLAGAEPLYRRALAIHEKALGPDHPNVAGSLNNLAALLEAKGDYAGAEPSYRRALAIAEKALGPDDPSSKKIRANLEQLLQMKSKTETKP